MPLPGVSLKFHGVISAFFLETGSASPAGDCDLPLASGDPELLSTVGTFEIPMLLITGDGPAQAKPLDGWTGQLQKPRVFLPPPGQVPGEKAEQGEYYQHTANPIENLEPGEQEHKV